MRDRLCPRRRPCRSLRANRRDKCFDRRPRGRPAARRRCMRRVNRSTRRRAATGRAHTRLRRCSANRARTRRGPLRSAPYRRRHGRRREILRLARRRRLGRRRTRGQQREGIDVSVRIGCQPDAELHIRLGPFRLTAGANRPDDLGLGHGGADRERSRSQVDERHRIAVLGTNCQAEPFAREVAREGHDPRHRSANVGPGRRPDVDAAVLTAPIWIPLEHERPEHRPIDRPRPGFRERDVGERDEQRCYENDHLVAAFDNHVGKSIEPLGCCQI